MTDSDVDRLLRAMAQRDEKITAYLTQPNQHQREMREAITGQTEAIKEQTQTAGSSQSESITSPESGAADEAPRVSWLHSSPSEITIGTGINNNAPITLTREDLVRHITVFGKSGTGKSTLLRSMFLDLVYEGAGIAVIDPHGNLVADLLRDIPENRLDDVVFLDLADPDYAFGINLFATKRDMSAAEKTQKVNQVKSLFRKVGGQTAAPLIETWIPVLSHTFLDAGAGTFVDIPRVLSDKAYRDRLTTHLENNFSRFYWQTHVDKNGMVYRDEIDSTIRRFGKFLTNPLLEQIVGQENTTIPFQKILDENMILLVSLPNDDEDTSALLGTVILQELFNATVNRRSNTLFAIIADECQLVTTPDLARFIDEARKRNVGIVLATQRVSKMDDDRVEEAMMNVGTLITLTVDYDDAVKLGRRFPRMAEPFQTYYVSPWPTVDINRHGHPNPRAVQLAKTLANRVSDESIRNGCDSVIEEKGNYTKAARDSILFLTNDRFGIKEDVPDLFFELHAICSTQPAHVPAGMHKPDPADKQLQTLQATHGWGTAVVNIQGQEHTITIASYDDSPELGKTKRIIQDSRERYYRLRAEVAADIRRRMNDNDDDEPPSVTAPVPKAPTPPKPYDLPVTRRARKS